MSSALGRTPRSAGWVARQVKGGQQRAGSGPCLRRTTPTAHSLGGARADRRVRARGVLDSWTTTRAAGSRLSASARRKGAHRAALGRPQRLCSRVSPVASVPANDRQRDVLANRVPADGQRGAGTLDRSGGEVPLSPAGGAKRPRGNISDVALLLVAKEARAGAGEPIYRAGHDPRYG
jgi:hypothetical protein